MTNEWTRPENWVPNTVPNGAGDVAMFSDSSRTDISLSGNVEVNKIVYSRGDSSPSFRVTLNLSVLNFTGEGIVNESGVLQSFVETVTDSITSLLLFFNNATAGENTSFVVPGGELTFFDSSDAGRANFTISGAGIRQGHLTFVDDGSAANATIVTSGNALTTFVDNSTAAEATFTTSDGGAVLFESDSTAAEATFVSDGGITPGRGGGGVDFLNFATAGQGNFTINGAAVAGAVAAHAVFDNSSTAGDATLTLAGGEVAGAEGSFLRFFSSSTAGNARLTANGGVDGGGGATIFFLDRSDGGMASLGVFANGELDIGNRVKPGVTIGSLEGDGLVYLGAKALVVGSNNRSVTFGGSIQDGGINQGTGGSVSKIGTGTWKLISANSYTGGTTVNEGALAVYNRSGSATGSGPVQVNAGVLAGKGTIAGAVTLGSGSGAGAVLAPGQGAASLVRLQMESSLTWKSDGSYRCRLNTKKGKSDQVLANGVTIDNGAQMDLQVIGQERLPMGRSATVINDTAATPITGRFANLPDGSTLSAGPNTLQVSYSGGDGNDFILTVVP